MSDRTPVIVAAKRTPIGKFMGGLSKVPAPVLGSYAIKAALDAVPAAKDHIEEVVMGCVLQAGLGQNPARQAALKAGLPDTMNCWTVNKVCGSGLQAVMLIAQAIKAGDIDAGIGGGLESMSLAPHLAHVRAGVKYGDAKLIDHMAADGLTCAFECWPMGNAAEHTANQHGITRADQDKWSERSNIRAAEATKNGWFKDEIAPLTAEQVMSRSGGAGGVEHDEGFRADTTMETLGKLRPAFDKAGSVTAGNASQISDGAAAIVVMTEKKAKELGLKILARITAYDTAGVAPKDLFTAPGIAVPRVLKKVGKTVKDVDLFEVNEAFAAQALANMKVAGINPDNVNVCGGAVAIGHPIGASGARVLTTLVHQMNRLDKKTGVAALCLGGGNAVAMVIER